MKKSCTFGVNPSSASMLLLPESYALFECVQCDHSTLAAEPPRRHQAESDNHEHKKAHRDLKGSKNPKATTHSDDSSRDHEVNPHETGKKDKHRRSKPDTSTVREIDDPTSSPRGKKKDSRHDDHPRRESIDHGDEYNKLKHEKRSGRKKK